LIPTLRRLIWPLAMCCSDLSLTEVRTVPLVLIELSNFLGLNVSANLWLAHRADTDKRFKALVALLKDAGAAFNQALVSGCKASDIESLLATGPRQVLVSTTGTTTPYNLTHLYLLAFAEASLPYKALRKFVTERSRHLTTLQVVDCTFGSVESLRLILKSAGPSLTALALRHATFLDSHSLKKLLSYCSPTHLKSLDISGALNVTELGILGIPSGVEVLLLANCPGLAIESLMDLASQCKSIRSLDLSGNSQLSDLVGEILSKAFPALTELAFAKGSDLARNGILCSALKHPSFATLGSLTSLDLSGAKNVTNLVLVTLAKASPGHLLSLRLSTCANITDEGLVPLLKKTPRLQTLTASTTLITDVAVKQLAASCPDTRNVAFELCDQIRGKELKRLFTKCSKLTSVNVSYWKEVGDEAFSFVLGSGESLDKALASPTAPPRLTLSPFALTSFSCVSMEKLSDGPIMALLLHCPALTLLNVANCLRLSNSFLQTLALHCPALETLYLNHLGLITDEVRKVPSLSNHSLTQFASSHLNLLHLTSLHLGSNSGLAFGFDGHGF